MPFHSCCLCSRPRSQKVAITIPSMCCTDVHGYMRQTDMMPPPPQSVHREKSACLLPMLSAAARVLHAPCRSTPLPKGSEGYYHYSVYVPAHDSPSFSPAASSAKKPRKKRRRTTRAAQREMETWRDAVQFGQEQNRVSEDRGETRAPTLEHGSPSYN